VLVSEEVYSCLASAIVEASLDKHAEKSTLARVNCGGLDKE
jgi:hypothetical protein